MEAALKFEQFQMLVQTFFDRGGSCGLHAAGNSGIDAAKLPSLVLAYIGDAYFTLFVRTRLLVYEQNKVRVLHTFDARIVSAAMQALAVKELIPALTEEEADVVRRGRNAKSSPTKNASVHEYRYSTGFEALLGYLYLSGNKARLSEIAEKAFVIISREMTNKAKKSGEEK